MDEVKVTNEKQAQKEYEDQQNEIDRSWYTLDEGGADIPELFNQHDEMDLYEKKQKQAGFQTRGFGWVFGKANQIFCYFLYFFLIYFFTLTSISQNSP